MIKIKCIPTLVLALIILIILVVPAVGLEYIVLADKDIVNKGPMNIFETIFKNRQIDHSIDKCLNYLYKSQLPF